MTKKKLNEYTWTMEGSDTRNTIASTHDNRMNMRDLLNTTGNGFCLAKWTQVTMHLGNGLTHSCHHPGAHSIPLDELKENPGALHNTNFKKERRKEMLRGERPSECDFCWRIEDRGEISDRTIKSMAPFSAPHHDKIQELDGDEDVFPTYVEVSFGRTCNFACTYCGPPFSSMWEQEIKKDGPYDVFGFKYNEIRDHEKHIPNREHNPYIEAFWKWFPEAYKHMHTFRITGGEPLMMKDTFKVMDFLIENPNPNLHFAINSNACPPGDLWDKFLEKVEKLVDPDRPCVYKFELYTSAEATGERCEFIRDGMNWDLFVKNIERYLTETRGGKLVFMCTYNILSASTFKNLLEWVWDLKQRFNRHPQTTKMEELGYFNVPDGHMSMQDRRIWSQGTSSRVAIDIPYLRNPKFLDAAILSKQMLKDFVYPAVDYMYKHSGNMEWDHTINFEDHECLKLKRNFMDAVWTVEKEDSDGMSKYEHISHRRAEFAMYMKQYGRRRGKDFLKTFPEYKDFYELCLKESQKLHGAPIDDVSFNTYWTKRKEQENESK